MQLDLFDIDSEPRTVTHETTAVRRPASVEEMFSEEELKRIREAVERLDPDCKDRLGGS